MTLSEQIDTDLKDAMKTGDRTKLQTLRLIRAHLIELTKHSRRRALRAHGSDQEAKGSDRAL